MPADAKGCEQLDGLVPGQWRFPFSGRSSLEEPGAPRRPEAAQIVGLGRTLAKAQHTRQTASRLLKPGQEIAIQCWLELLRTAAEA